MGKGSGDKQSSTMGLFLAAVFRDWRVTHWGHRGNKGTAVPGWGEGASFAPSQSLASESPGPGVPKEALGQGG